MENKQELLSRLATVLNKVKNDKRVQLHKFVTGAFPTKKRKVRQSALDFFAKIDPEQLQSGETINVEKVVLQAVGRSEVNNFFFTEEALEQAVENLISRGRENNLYGEYMPNIRLRALGGRILSEEAMTIKENLTAIKTDNIHFVSGVGIVGDVSFVGPYSALAEKLLMESTVKDPPFSIGMRYFKRGIDTGPILPITFDLVNPYGD